MRLVAKIFGLVLAVAAVASNAAVAYANNEHVIGESRSRAATTAVTGTNGYYVAWTDGAPAQVGGHPGVHVSGCDLTFCDADEFSVPGSGNATFGPGVAWLNNRLYVVWRGQDAGFADGVMYMTSSSHPSSDPADWTPVVRAVPDGATSGSPYLIAVRDRLQMVWKGLGNDVVIYTSWTTNGITWAPQIRAVPDGGTTTDPSMTIFRDTTTKPDSTERLQLAWRGIGNDSRIFTSHSYDGTHWSPQYGVGFGPLGTNAGPSIFSAGDEHRGLSVVWKGNGDDDPCVYFTHGFFNTNNELVWYTQNAFECIHARTTTTPAVRWNHGGIGNNASMALILNDPPRGPTHQFIHSGDYSTG